jgi:hypothetical protein
MIFGQKGTKTMDKKIIASFPRSKDERLVVSIGTYKSDVYIDIRVFFTSRPGGELLPTKKGVTIKKELLPLLIDALTACKSEALLSV